MKIEWKDCDYETTLILNNWLQKNEEISKFAIFDETFTDELNYYKNNKNIFPGEISNFVKVVYIDNKLIAYVVLNYGLYENKRELSINPIVINPEETNKGFAKIIIKDLIANYRNFVKDLDLITVSIDKKNTLSVKLFNSLKFDISGTSEDNLFDYYQYLVK